MADTSSLMTDILRSVADMSARVSARLRFASRCRATYAMQIVESPTNADQPRILEASQCQLRSVRSMLVGN